MLDADDWWYPWKLEQQVKFLNANSHVAIASGGMAIVDATGNLAGVRGCGDDGGCVPNCMTRLTAPPMAFAPSMVSREVALRAGFDATFSASEDADFLLRIMAAGNAYCKLPHVIYVYTEYDTLNLKKLRTMIACARRMFWAQRDRFPIASRLRICQTILKEAIYCIGCACGQLNRMIRRRSSPPLEQEREEFEKARSIVLETKRRIFGPMTDVDITSADIKRSAVNA
jgi:hypothetical protein